MTTTQDPRPARWQAYADTTPTPERCDAEPFCTSGQRPVPAWGAVGYVRAVLDDVLDRLPAGPERDRLGDALDVLRRAGDR